MTKDYPLDQLAGFPANAKLTIDGATDADVLQALAGNQPLPARELTLGRIGVDFSGKTDTPLKTGLGEVTFNAAAHARLGVGVADKSATVLEQFALADAAELNLSWDDATGQRYAYLVAGYEVSAAASGKHPIGALGAATFGVDAKQASTFATVSRFAPATGADDVLKQLVKGWRLPATISDATDLAPGTTVLVEADGSFGVKLGAQLGYDFSFVRAVQAGGLSGDLGLKVATALSTQLGFSASGKFLICVERATGAPALRLRLFKLRKNGWTFALNLTVGATAVTPLPDTIDDFVEAVFGVQGKQVIADLKKLEQWTDPKKSTGELVAGLVNKEALALIKDTTGIDPEVKFEEARKKFLDGIEAWQALPGRASAWLWQETTAGLDAAAKAQLQGAVTALASPSDDAIKKFIADEVQQAGFDQGRTGRLINSLADEGVLTLLDRAPDVRKAAGFIQRLIDGDFLEKLQGRIAAALDLDQIIKAANENDWKKVDGWLLGRLGTFFGETLQFNKLDAIRGTINAVIGKRDQLYHALHEAVTKTYEAKFAYAYESATTRTALIDATFDFSQPPAKNAFGHIVARGAWDDVFLAPIPGVTLASGVLTHGIARQTNIQFTLPLLPDYNLTAITNSLARLSVASEGSLVVGTYDLAASNEVKSAGRFASKLTIAAGVPVIAHAAGGGLRRHGQPTFKWNYTYRFAKARASLDEMGSLLDPIQRSYFAAKFGAGGTSFRTWLATLDDTIEGKLHNGANNFGDILVSLEVLLNGELLGSWFTPGDKATRLAAACRASRAVQQTLRATLFDAYTADLAKITVGEGTCALLVYAALPPVNELKLDGDGQIVSSGKAPYWNWPDKDLVRALVRADYTSVHLVQKMRLLASRLHGSEAASLAPFFADRPPSDIITQVAPVFGDYSGNLRGLLMNESIIVTGLQNALDEIAGFTAGANLAPAKALQALSTFGATITQTFNKNVRSNYGPPSIQTIGSDLFCDASRAIGSTADEGVRTRLALSVLAADAKFDLAKFVSDGDNPTAAQVAHVETLTRGLLA